MAGTSLLALIDDIASILDDVAVLSKVAAKKTAGVLGDDLALNAQQVAGVRAERELPVVWAVAKGSFKNKLILVPAALLISAIAPWAIPILLVIGGAYLCYEGVEKLHHKFFHPEEDKASQRQSQIEAISNPDIDMVEFEQEKIKGAIRTDFILSAEIIVIILGSSQDADFWTQVTVLSGLAIAFTVGVYGLVAAIVKLDDAGLFLVNNSNDKGTWNKVKTSIGRFLLNSAPYLMKTLSIVGTAAMFLVGGGILVHSVETIHHVIEAIISPLANISVINFIAPLLMEALVGILLGILVLSLVQTYQKLKPAS